MGDSPETLRGQFQTAQLVYDLITQLIISDGTDDDAPGSQPATRLGYCFTRSTR